MTQSTIAAIATAPGRGGIGIIRISGPKAADTALALIGKIPPPRYAQHTTFVSHNGTPIDEGLALYFPAPHSFTGENVLELHAHGGPVVLNMLLKEILALGIDMARPGEFSERAYLNHKMDLVQAEAIADLINASSEQAARSAVRSLQGEFSKQIENLLQQLITLRVYVESAIDFPEEEIDFLSDGHIQTQLENLIETLGNIQKTATQGALLQTGITVVIAGHPNAGKSSLLNQLSGQETAIVTDIPGTTRDVIRENIQLNGMPVHIIDTAGLRESDDPIEQEGIRRAHKEIEKADRILLILDSTTSQEIPLSDILKTFFKQSVLPQNITVIHNKIDLSQNKPSLKKNKMDYRPIEFQGDGKACTKSSRGAYTQYVSNEMSAQHSQNLKDNGYIHIFLSAKTGEGIELLKQHLIEQAGLHNFSENTFSARTRHLNALSQIHQHLNHGLAQLTDYRAGELLAEELRLAQDTLSEITGTFLSDDLLGEIFSSFCIGK